MAKVIFSYEGEKIKIQCNENDLMKDIINKFLKKIKKEEYELYYIYNGKKLNYELTFNEQANNLDKELKKMNIIVLYVKGKKGKNEIISKDIICPECKDNILIELKKFQINLFGCNQNHSKNNINIYSFEETQKIDLNKIVCDICINNNKGDAHNNSFYKCNTCNKNICPLCNSIHDKNHFIINYDDKNYICNKHNDAYSKYCEECKENICLICENKHINHKIFDFKNILLDKNELLKLMSNLKDVLDKFKSKIKIIKEIFDKLVNIMDLYYNINNNIINNYNINKRNH